MIDPDEHETAAIEAAGEFGGEYLESIGKTDLATMTVEEWLAFVEAIVTGYQDKLVALLGSPDDDA